MGNRKNQHSARPSPGKQRTQTRSLSEFVIPFVVFLVVAVVAGGVVISSGSQRAQIPAAPAGGSVPLVTAPPLSTQPLPYPDVPRASLQETVEKLEQGQAMEDRPFYVCQVCGNTVEGEAPERCPVCGAPKRMFKAVE